MSPKSTVDRAKARSQWLALCSVLKQSGYEPVTIDPVPDREDMVFAANQTFVGAKDGYGKFVVPSRMVYDSRQKEVPFYVDWFRQRGYRVIDLDFGDDRLEGGGDLIWHPDRSRVYAGYGFRSTRGGVEKFAAAMTEMEIPVIPLQLVDRFCYHLDTCLAPLNNDAALIYPDAFAPADLDALTKYWKRVHCLTHAEAHRFMGNGIVANGNYITSHTTPHLEEILRQESLKPLLVDTSEFEKGGGSAFCMKTFLP